MKRILLLICIVLYHINSIAATLPANFTEKRLAQGLDATGVTILPDDRIIITEKGGKVWIIKNEGTPAIFVTIPNVDTYFERGLQGAVADPDFATNNYIYFYYTYKNPTNNVSNNRVVRYTANGDVADAGTFQIIFELPTLNAGNHNGGGMAFGPDGYLYISTGENAVTSNSQAVNNLLGKILRIDKSGSIPTSNPFYTTNTGQNRAVYALGLRNPFKLNKNPTTGKIMINEVGQSTWEEIDTLRAGANYGWPGIEGKRTTQTMPTNYTDPIYVYQHSGGACSITGGSFYAPANVAFPAQYNGKYFFMEYCSGYIAYINPASPGTATMFATGLQGAVDMAVDSKGNMYYLERGAVSNTSSTGELWKITYAGTGNISISLPPQSQTVSVGAKVTFSVQTTGTGTITYQWKKNGVDIPNANSASYVIDSATMTDNGAKFSVFVSNGTSNQTSTEALLTVIKNDAPVATIDIPTAGTLYIAGTILNFSGTATDTEDGTLPASAFSWKIDFHHDTHIHPGLDLTTGIKSGTLTIPDQGETSANVWYRIYLTVTDSKGATTTVERDVYPKKTTIILESNPLGIPLLLDGSPVVTPFSVVSVVGVKRVIEGNLIEKKGAQNYAFVNWSNAGTRAQTITTPASTTTYTATYEAVIIDSLNANADAYVRAGTNADITFGTTDSTQLISKQDAATLSSNREIYLRFALKKYTGIMYSFLELTGARNNAAPNAIPVSTYQVTNDNWNEKTITWNNRPARGTVALDTAMVYATTPTLAKYQWNVLDYFAQKVLANNNFISFGMANPNSTPNTYTAFNSKEAVTGRPKLIVIYKGTVTTLSEESEIQALVSLYPNPAASTSSISVLSRENITQLEITDLKGTAIRLIQVSPSKKVEFSIQDIAQGIYVLNVHTDNHVRSMKLVIR